MMRLRALLFAVCMLVVIVPIRAATYYVDAERGNDTNNGTSAIAAWKTLSRVNQEKFRPGDSVLFRRGQIWREQLNFQASGEAERAITVDAYGEGALPEISGADVAPAEGWTACQSCGANIWGIAAGRKGPSPRGLRIERNEIVNSAGDGLHLEGVQGSTVDANLVANNENVGIQIYRSLEAFPASDVTVSNNEVHHNHFIGINMAGCPAGESCRTIRNENQLTVTKVKITGNKCYANGAGIYLHQTTDSLVSGNISHDNTDTSRRGEGYGVGLSGSSNNIVERNECYGAAHAGIELSIDISKPAVGSTNNIVRYNLVHDNGSNGLMTDYMPTQGNRFVYNMVFNHPNGSCIFANNKGHVFANNTCVNNRDGIYLYVSKTTPETGEITVKNNIIVNSQKYHVVVEKGVQGPITFDNNEYFPDDRTKFNWKDSPSNFEGWRAKSGGDAKSFVADPLLRSPNPQKAEDFALQSGSPAIGKGENLGAELEEALSAQNGTQASMRATKQPAKWDLGAVQHSSP